MGMASTLGFLVAIGSMQPDRLNSDCSVPDNARSIEEEHSGALSMRPSVERTNLSKGTGCLSVGGLILVKE
jgi:hypothetical protein